MSSQSTKFEFNEIFLDSPFESEKDVTVAKSKVQCLPQKYTWYCIARDMRMLYIKMFISNAVREII